MKAITRSLLVPGLLFSSFQSSVAGEFTIEPTAFSLSYEVSIPSRCAKPLFEVYEHQFSWIRAVGWYEQLLSGEVVTLNGCSISTVDCRARQGQVCWDPDVWVPKELLVQVPLQILFTKHHGEETVYLGVIPTTFYTPRLQQWITELANTGATTIEFNTETKLSIRIVLEGGRP